MESAITFRGASGALFNYFISAPPWFSVPANYLFAKVVSVRWYVIYVGQCQNAEERFPTHERWDEAARVYGATHILTHVASPIENVRKTEERDLILALNPPMNVQHKTQNVLRSLLG